MSDDWEPRQPIFPAEWLEENAWMEENSPLPTRDLEESKALYIAYGYKPPYTVDEIKKLFPGLYFKVEH